MWQGCGEEEKGRCLHTTGEDPGGVVGHVVCGTCAGAEETRYGVEITVGG